MSKPQVITPETKVVGSSADQSRRLRRWPFIWTLAFAVGASLLIWAGVFALVGMVGAALF